MASETIPVICLDRLLVAEKAGGDALRQEEALLRRACAEVGFFYLEGHGVHAELRERVFACAKEFFSLDEALKQEVAADENHRGYTRMLDESLDPTHQSMGDTKEGFYVGKEVPLDDPRAALPLHGPNQWPASLGAAWRSALEEYRSALTAVALSLLPFFAGALGIGGRGFFESCFSDPMVFVRLLHYSAVKSSPYEGIYGCGAHTDFGMLTLLATDDVPGLQIHTAHLLEEGAEARWLDVPPRPGAFIVNIGDMLERWSNGIFQSTRHRVVNMEGRERYSIPFFFEPNFDTRVECLECCISEERQARYPATTSGQHLLDKYAQTSQAFASVTQ